MVDGILLLDKPSGMTSFSVVRKIRDLTGVKKVGHTGTLDPNASGLLLICLGRATKASASLTNEYKEYNAQLVLGLTTDTEDVTGKVLGKKEVNVSRKEVEKVLEKFRGRQEQVPPMYSAVHHKGKRLYELARKGIIVDRKKREIEIRELEIVDFLPESITLSVVCSKGTYVRTLCHDIGEELGCGGCLGTLRRVRIGDFFVSRAKGLKEVEELSSQGKLAEFVIPVGSINN